MEKGNESKFFNFKEQELTSNEQSNVKGGGWWSVGPIYAYWDQVVECSNGDTWFNIGGGLSPCGDGEYSVAPDPKAVC